MLTKVFVCEACQLVLIMVSKIRIPDTSLGGYKLKHLLLAGIAATTLFCLPAHQASAQGESAQTQEAPVATTQYGKVRGHVKDGVNVFMGIPYGADTFGQRFEPPQPPEAWNGILDANAFPDSIPQTAGNTPVFKSWAADPAPEMSEDVLGLNVWTPGLDDRKRPVMVWLHGGGFQTGSGSSRAYEGVNLANRGDVVVVTINHRLNAFGYLYLAGLSDDPRYADSGNVGTLDMVQALEWVRDNIASFGGNPDNVTIFGESGGGRKVSVLNAMESAEGLFDRAIVQSGSSLSFRTPEQATKDTRDFLKAVDIAPDKLDMLDKLTQDEIIAGLYKAASTSNSSFYWGPVVDGRSLTKNPFTVDGPEPNANVPMLIGSNKDELSLWLVRPGREVKLDYAAAAGLIGDYVNEAEFDALVEDYRAIYPDQTDGELMVTLTTDIRYTGNAVRQAKAKAAEGTAPVWLYQFDWETPVMGGIYKTPHATEIPFAFDTLGNSESMIGDAAAAQDVADQVSEAWISFARHGDPNARGLPFWPEVTTDNVVAMHFNHVSTVDDEYFDAEGEIIFAND